MSKLGCRCGNIISDILAPCPTEGWILRDQDQEAYEDGVCQDIAAFFRAVTAGDRVAWIGGFFGPNYPTDGSDASVINDILAYGQREFFRCIAECDRCGRLWVQREACVNSYMSFAPDEPGYASLLRVKPAVGASPCAVDSSSGVEGPGTGREG